MLQGPWHGQLHKGCTGEVLQLVSANMFLAKACQTHVFWVLRRSSTILSDPQVALQDVMARYKETGHKNWKDFPSKACFQMNDTHPTVAVAELMRLLIDQEGLDWEEAWSITTQVNQSAALSCCLCTLWLGAPTNSLAQNCVV